MKLFPVVILAGGLATRLRPMTETLPKSLVIIKNKPFIAHQLHLLKQNGIRDIVICLGHLGEQVVSYIESQNNFGMNISYAHDGRQLMGTAGAIKQALSLIPEDFFILYGDSYLPCDFSAVQASYKQQRQPALMTVFRNNNLGDMSNVVFHQGAILNYDKKNHTPDMAFIDYGLGIFNKIAFADVPKNLSYDLALLYQQLLKKHMLAAYEVQETFYEVGSFAGIQALESYLSIE